MATTLKDLARACGMDVSTVSRALRDDPRVKASTRERIRTLAVGLGYRPNLAARALVVGKSRVVWFLLPSFRATIEQIPAHHASSFLGERGYDLMAVLHRNDAAVYQRHLARLTQGMADGALIIPNTALDDGGLVRSLLRQQFPLVFIDRYPRDLADAPRVVNDNAGSSREMLVRLAAAGVRRVVSLFGAGNNAEEGRRNGLLAAAAELGLPLVEGAKFANARAGEVSEATAVMATAQGTIHNFIQEHPELARLPLYFGCFDGWVGEPHPARGVVVVKQDFEGMARQACDLLLALIAKRPAEPCFTVPCLAFDWVEPRF